MAPNPLTPIAEEQLSPPQFPTPVHETSELDVNANVKEDRGCVFFYDKPQLKGNFYDDSFFRNAQKNYEEAVKQFLSSSEIDSIFPQSSSDMMSSLRERNQLAETQVYGLTELEDIYQVRLIINFIKLSLKLKLPSSYKDYEQGHFFSYHLLITSVNNNV